MQELELLFSKNTCQRVAFLSPCLDKIISEKSEWLNFKGVKFAALDRKFKDR